MSVSMQLPNKLKKQLKAKAHSLQPSVYVGNNGISEGVIKALNEALDANELVKVRLRCEDQPSYRGLLEQLRLASDAHLIQSVGHTASLYREAKE